VTLFTFGTWIVVAILTAWGAGTMMTYGGPGLTADVLLGLAGSGAAWLMTSTIDMVAQPGIATTAVVAFAGAVATIALQRRFFPAPTRKSQPPPWR